MQFANLQWKQQQPYSLDFDDIYYSSDNGLAESDYVFIQHNQLTERFRQLEKDHFTIIETGFGTGLNFFCAAQHFLAHSPKSAALQFISIERYPLTMEDFVQANRYWFVFDQMVKQLTGGYAQMKDGFNQLRCCDGRIALDLWIGDVNALLPQINSTADAWFLDGFAPSKNADMWSESLFEEITRLSKTDSTFATFTSAGDVRRRLQSAGFNVRKDIGFGKKREMLYGLSR
ncbi:MAG: tRNA (5-methylaminomethyl-2-thiouridine)(34)-methyltransferase MnmD [Methylophilaceae bacterium]|nr:tRNA (5-methylaminomethyl-2-thiouridine)(34)-methyltransferase MnmD [Methylophilaceae bacterium]